MIKQFQHKGLENFYLTGNKAGIQAGHDSKLSRQLTALQNAKKTNDMKMPGWDWHPFKGHLANHWSVKVNGNWRLTFAFDGSDAILVDYQDYH